MNPKLYPLLAVVALLLGACAGLTQPQTFEQRLAYAYGSHTAVQEAAASSLDAGALHSSDAESLLDVADRARTLLDAARTAYRAGDVSTAEGRLELATALLTELQQYLHRRART
jgi:hypothetical protein